MQGRTWRGRNGCRSRYESRHRNQRRPTYVALARSDGSRAAAGWTNAHICRSRPAADARPGMAPPASFNTHIQDRAPQDTVYRPKGILIRTPRNVNLSQNRTVAHYFFTVFLFFQFLSTTHRRLCLHNCVDGGSAPPGSSNELARPGFRPRDRERPLSAGFFTPAKAGRILRRTNGRGQAMRADFHDCCDIAPMIPHSCVKSVECLGDRGAQRIGSRLELQRGFPSADKSVAFSRGNGAGMKSGDPTRPAAAGGAGQWRCHSWGSPDECGPRRSGAGDATAGATVRFPPAPRTAGLPASQALFQRRFVAVRNQKPFAVLTWRPDRPSSPASALPRPVRRRHERPCF